MPESQVTSLFLLLMPTVLSEHEPTTNMIPSVANIEHGEPHRNAAGDFLHVWAGQRHLFAATTLFPGPKPQNGCGTWRHPRTKKVYQNDHVFVQNGRRHRVLQCKYSSPLCATDHLAVKLSVRVQVHLEKSPAATDAEKMAQLDHSVIRPFQPNFDPSTSIKWLQAVETHVLENVVLV